MNRISKSYKLIIAFFIILITTTSASDLITKRMIDVEVDSVSIFFEGKEIDITNYIYEGKTLVGLRDLSENLGFEVTWNGETSEIDIDKKSEPLATPMKDKDALYVKMEDLIEYPDKYDGKYIWVKGYWVGGNIEGELYSDKYNFDNKLTKNALELDFAVTIIVDTFPNSSEEEFGIEPGHNVLLKGKFNKNTINKKGFGGRLEAIDGIDII